MGKSSLRRKLSSITSAAAGSDGRVILLPDNGNQASTVLKVLWPWCVESLKSQFRCWCDDSFSRGPTDDSGGAGIRRKASGGNRRSAVDPRLKLSSHQHRN